MILKYNLYPYLVGMFFVCLEFVYLAHLLMRFYCYTSFYRFDIETFLRLALMCINIVWHIFNRVISIVCCFLMRGMFFHLLVLSFLVLIFFFTMVLVSWIIQYIGLLWRRFAAWLAISLPLIQLCDGILYPHEVNVFAGVHILMYFFL